MIMIMIMMMVIIMNVFSSKGIINSDYVTYIHIDSRHVELVLWFGFVLSDNRLLMGSSSWSLGMDGWDLCHRM